jgi:stage V sporulation protein D (sporulation-specific penicillin-binding protein)/penicillin-binding protein 2B
MKKPLRSRLIQLGFIATAMIFVGRIWYIQSSDPTLTKAEREYMAEETIMPRRGTIYDANGNVLAFDRPSYDMDMDAQALRRLPQAELNGLIRDLSHVTHAPQALLRRTIEQPAYVWVRIYPYLARLTWTQKQRVMTVFRKHGLLEDVNPYKTYLRVYPDGAFASQVVGFVDQTHQGASGVEYEYNKYLAGKPGTVHFAQDDLGDPIPFDPEVIKPVQNGDAIYLTINSVLQHYAQEALKVVERRFHPKHAAIIIEDPDTGAILTLATLPDYNPNDYWRYPASTLDTDWALASFEPGSTFKDVTITGALATHSIRLNQTYMSGVDYVNGVPIHDWNIWGWGRLTYAQAMIYSSNVGFIHIGQAEGVKNFYHYMYLFGMTKKTGIDLPGEEPPIIFPEKNLNAVDFATMTFGQGLSVTPIQQVMAAGAIANGGLLLHPYVVQKIVAPDGKVLLDQKPVVVRRVASRAIMKEVTNLMVKVVADDPQGTYGTIQGYQVAGKTGTAQIPKPGGGFIPHLYNLSFLGFAPAQDPKLLIYVTVSEAHNEAKWGDWVATPAAHFVLKRALHYMRIPPVGGEPNQFAADPHTTYVTMPKLTGGTASFALRQLRSLGLAVRTFGTGTTVLRQWPNPGAKLQIGSPVALLESPVTALHSMPDLLGLTEPEALSICRTLGLLPNPVGIGYMAEQSVAPGSSVRPGQVINLTFGTSPHGTGASE